MPFSVLVHICCGPCAITVLQRLRDAGHELCGLFFNPNIHPLAEYMRRREGAAMVADKLGIPMIFADSLPEGEQVWALPSDLPSASGHTHGTALPGTGPFLAAGLSGGSSLPSLPGPLAALPPAVNPVPWLRAVTGHEHERCPFCWLLRLHYCATMAKARGFSAFTSSLLYSRYQKHDILKGMGEALALQTGLVFAYEDFRTSWQQGIALSKEWGVYRQQYCGCVYSEYERYTRELRCLCRPEAAPQPSPFAG